MVARSYTSSDSCGVLSMRLSSCLDFGFLEKTSMFLSCFSISPPNCKFPSVPGRGDDKDDGMIGLALELVFER